MKSVMVYKVVKMTVDYNSCVIYFFLIICCTPMYIVLLYSYMYIKKHFTKENKKKRS